MAESDDKFTNADSSVASPDMNKTHRGCAVWRGIRFRIAHVEDEVGTVDDVPLQDLKILFEKLGVEIRSDVITEWLSDTIVTLGSRSTLTQRFVRWCLVQKTVPSLKMKNHLKKKKILIQ